MIILALLGYIVYEKFTDNNFKTNNNDTNTTETLSLENNTILNLYNTFTESKWYNTCGSYFSEASTKTTVQNLTEVKKLQLAFSLVKNSELVEHTWDTMTDKRACEIMSNKDCTNFDYTYTKDELLTDTVSKPILEGY